MNMFRAHTPQIMAVATMVRTLDCQTIGEAVLTLTPSFHFWNLAPKKDEFRQETER